MSLTKRSNAGAVYLQVKHFCLWQELKKPTAGSETIEVTNPKTKAVIAKHGNKFDNVEGHASDLVAYDTGKKYDTRYFGFKLYLRDGIDFYVLDMPYNSQILRRFLRVAPNIDWALPLSITVFKGHKPNSDKEETGVWFRQEGTTIKPYFTRETPHGMPEATFDDDLQQWDFKAQHRWLVDRLKEHTVSEIKDAEKQAAPPVDPHIERSPDEDPSPSNSDGQWEVSDDDVPF